MAAENLKEPLQFGKFFEPVRKTITVACEPVYFNPATPAGSRGRDGLRILVFEPNRRLAFTWNAPPHQPYVRAQRTVVYVDFESLPSDRTKLTFTHTGWHRARVGQGLRLLRQRLAHLRAAPPAAPHHPRSRRLEQEAGGRARGVDAEANLLNRPRI